MCAYIAESSSSSASSSSCYVQSFWQGKFRKLMWWAQSVTSHRADKIAREKESQCFLSRFFFFVLVVRDCDRKPTIHFKIVIKFFFFLLLASCSNQFVNILQRRSLVFHRHNNFSSDWITLMVTMMMMMMTMMAVVLAVLHTLPLAVDGYDVFDNNERG